MARAQIVDLRLYPDDCDSYGHVNQAAFLRLFERSRWEVLALGPGVDVFTRAGAWPAIRQNHIEYHAPAFAGELLSFELHLTHLGRTSMTFFQRARRKKDGVLVATAHVVAVCIDGNGKPVDVPAAMGEYMGTRPAIPAEPVREVKAHGATFAVETQGDGDAILFIHGFPFDRTMWRQQVAACAGWHRIAPDLRGFGLSDAAPEEWRIGDHADDMAALLDALGVKRAVVCGLSMGGYVAFEVLRRHRERVRALVLANTRDEADSTETKRARGLTIAAVRERGMMALVESMLPKLLSPATVQAAPRVRSQVETMILDNSPAGAIPAIAALRDRADSADLLQGLDIPVLVVAGSEDAIIPAATQSAMAGKITGAELVVVPGAGHITPMEQPEVFSRALLSFLHKLR